MTRGRTPRDAFGRPLAPDQDRSPARPSAEARHRVGSGPAADEALPAPSKARRPRPAVDAGATPVTRSGEADRGEADRGAPDRASERRWESSAPRAPGGVPPDGVPAANPQATVALVLGILGFCVLPLLLSVAAIVVGHRAARVAEALPGAPGLRAARAGRILGWCGLLFWLLVPVFVGLLFAVSVSTSP